MSLSVGTKLGPYQIEAPIGAGGMGEVYKARDARLGRNVAVKISREQFSERFSREARTISSLNHPNICTLYDVGPNYLVTELVEGETLRDWMKRAHAVERCFDIARQVLEALRAAHRAGIVHRDLKPANGYCQLVAVGVRLGRLVPDLRVHQAHVTSSQTSKERERKSRWLTDRSRWRPIRKRFWITPCTDQNRCT